MKLRIAAILSVISVLFVYVGWRLSESLGTTGAVLAMSVLFLGLFFFRPAHAIKNRALRQTVMNLIHLEMGFLSFLFTLIALRDLIFLPLSFLKPDVLTWAYSPQATTGLLGLSCLAVGAGLYVAYAGPWVVRVNVPIQNLPADLDGFSVAQLSDMHIGPNTTRARIDAIVEKTLALKPDVVAFTGDIGDGPVAESQDAVASLRKLAERVPCYYVTGNHEYYWKGSDWVEAFRAVGLTPLLNASAIVKRGSSRVLIAGTPDPTARSLGPGEGPDVKRAIANITHGSGQDASVKILLAHQPGISHEAREAGIDLQLSGHTHAGQFFPWTLVVKRVHEFSQGLGRTGRTWVYVNPGTGSWGPQIRLGTKTEITLLTFTKDV